VTPNRVKDNLLMRFLILSLILVCMGLGCTSAQDSGEEVHSAGEPPSLPQNTTQTDSVHLEITAVTQPPPPITQDTVSPEAPPPLAYGIIGPRVFPGNVNPLTGEVVPDPAILERRPIVAKISNAPAIVRPQAGLGAADIVFEHYVEGGLTRFSAVFYSQAPERVGSIRSARLVDHEIAPMFDGMLAFSGASIGVEKYIYGSEEVASRIDGADTVPPGGFVPPSEYADRAYKGVLYGRPFYWRDETIPVPHNMFANIAALWDLAASEGQAQRPRLEGLTFYAGSLDGSTGEGQIIDVRYRATRVRWEYDEGIGQYRRYTDGQGHLDAVSRQQITATNVVILFAEHTDTNIVESEWQGSISWSTQIALWGENPVILCRDGQRYDGIWMRTVREDLISFWTLDGGQLPLKPGNTWIQIVRTQEQQDPDTEWIVIE
jgi:hypothetical protein